LHKSITIGGSANAVSILAQYFKVWLQKRCSLYPRYLCWAWHHHRYVARVFCQEGKINPSRLRFEAPIRIIAIC